MTHNPEDGKVCIEISAEAAAKLAQLGLENTTFTIDPTVDGGTIGTRLYESKPAPQPTGKDYPDAPYLVN